MSGKPPRKGTHSNTGGQRPRTGGGPRGPSRTRESRAHGRNEAPVRVEGDGGILRVQLARGKSKPFWIGHPWVFSGAIQSVRGEVGDMGAECLVEDERGNVLGWGYYNPLGQIAVRLWSHRRTTDRVFETPTFAPFFEKRARAALALRENLGLTTRTDLNVYRLINAEGDGLSGLIVDRLGDVLSIQINSRAMEQRRGIVVDTLRRLTGLERLLVSVTDTAARMETLVAGVDRIGPPDFLSRGTHEVLENGLKMSMDLGAFQKTGFYADQRDNRMRFAALCKGQQVLDAYCHTGAFGLQAARHGAAHVTMVDSSEPTVEAARRNATLNGLSDKTEILAEDAINFFKERHATGQTWDRIVVDPPKFAQGRSHIDDAIQKYARLNTLALATLSDRGLLLTCSCSRHVSEADFGRMLTDAGHRLRKGVQILGAWGQPDDHPTQSVAPEGRYLKAWLVAAADM